LIAFPVGSHSGTFACLIHVNSLECKSGWATPNRLPLGRSALFPYWSATR